VQQTASARRNSILQQDQAIAAGGTTYNEPQDRGFMYAHGFQDLDGHIWEIVYMEPDAGN
jgi:predicted lactoylglutathione lyase